tara:strand:+ start:80288 stop:81049 length:762 start_codon:yes stop_codon:yes gene_type:complete
MTEEKSFLSKHGLLIGIVLSVGYTVGVIYILWPNPKYFLYFNLNDLSKLGGYLSGAFSPLAFLWLVIGYLMQNSELKNTLQEHKSNTREVKRIRAYEETIKRNNIQPIFRITSVNDSSIHGHFSNYMSITFEFKNIGESVLKFRITEIGTEKDIFKRNVLARNEEFNITFFNDEKDMKNIINFYYHDKKDLKSELKKVIYGIYYQDLHGEEHCLICELTPEEKDYAFICPSPLTCLPEEYKNDFEKHIGTNGV